MRSHPNAFPANSASGPPIRPLRIPYLLSLDVLVERLCFEIGRSGNGVIVAEKRDPTLDRQLDIAWLNLKVQGTRYIQAKDIESRVVREKLRRNSRGEYREFGLVVLPK